jgi:hypothetical protein
MELLIIFTRRYWYLKKSFIIPISLLTVLLIGAIILGTVLWKKAHINPTSMIFDILFSSNKSPISLLQYFSL